jgi:hypothetical protein
MNSGTSDSALSGRRLESSVTMVPRRDLAHRPLPVDELVALAPHLVQRVEGLHLRDALADGDENEFVTILRETTRSFLA